MTSCLIRPATLEDAAAAVAVLRASITELCVVDHQNDAATLEHWLRNKTIEQFQVWLANPENFVAVAELESVVCGVGLIHASGEIRLCYAQPGRQRLGIGCAMLGALEAQAISWGLREIRLGSSATARSFYERHGYVSTGESVARFGIVRCYPYSKVLDANPNGAD